MMIGWYCFFCYQGYIYIEGINILTVSHYNFQLSFVGCTCTKPYMVIKVLSMIFGLVLEKQPIRTQLYPIYI